MLSIEGKVRLISDLHLQPEEPVVTDRFLRFLENSANQQVAALFILGDLFEYWVGDDALAEGFNARICAALKALAARGTVLYFIHGNRDFLIGNTMASACGLRLLPELANVSLGGTACLLLHGDTLCTDDVAYQQFRKVIRSPDWQANFLDKPLTERLAEVAKLRERSREAMQTKSAEIMDANPMAVRAAMENNRVTRLIHGHTHRPGVESMQLTTGHGERWVLSDWTIERADAIEIDSDGIRRLDLLA